MIEIRVDGSAGPELMERLEPDWIASAMNAALASESRAGDVCVLLAGAQAIQALNRDYRGMDAVTDVLTFPAWEGEALLAPPDGYLGDVAICVPRAVEQAEAFGHSLRREMTFLSVHGALHLLGFDHMTPRDEAVMLAKQEQILSDMGVMR